LTARSEAIGSESRFLPTPPASFAPVMGLPVGMLPCHAVWYVLTRIVWLPDGETNDDMFIRFDRIDERDRHADRQTDRQTPHDDKGRACIASRGKN